MGIAKLPPQSCTCLCPSHCQEQLHEKKSSVPCVSPGTGFHLHGCRAAVSCLCELSGRASKEAPEKKAQLRLSGLHFFSEFGHPCDCLWSPKFQTCSQAFLHFGLHLKSCLRALARVSPSALLFDPKGDAFQPSLCHGADSKTTAWVTQWSSIHPKPS